MNFSKVYGHDYVLDGLAQSLKSNTVSHAYIFEGPTGVGKKTVANIFAKALVCENGGDKPCNNCKSCLLFEAGSHPDVKHILPDLSIGVDAIREVVKDVLVKPYYNKKVYIIEDADKMTSQAQNSLLKTLEEPPQYAVIILITENISNLLPTIISRSTIKKFTRNSEGDIERYIKENYSDDIGDIKAIISLADGAIGNAKRFIESEEFSLSRKDNFNIFKRIFNCNKFEVLGIANAFSKNKENIDVMLHLMLLWFRDILIIKQTREPKFVINIDYYDELEKVADKLSQEKIEECIDAVLEAKNNLSANTNLSLTIDVMFLKICE